MAPTGLAFAGARTGFGQDEEFDTLYPSDRTRQSGRLVRQGLPLREKRVASRHLRREQYRLGSLAMAAELQGVEGRLARTQP
jgi:hypothetical protein